MPACFGHGWFCWIILIMKKWLVMISTHVSLSLSFSSKTWLLKMLSVGCQQPYCNMLTLPFFEERFVLCVCQWTSSCAQSPCDVLMLRACAKFNEPHNYVIIWESLKLKWNSSKKGRWLSFKIVFAAELCLNPVWSQREAPFENVQLCIHCIMQQQDIRWTVFVFYSRVLQSI